MSNSSPQLIDLIVPTADEHDAFVRIRNRSKDAVLNLAADFHHCLTVSKTEDRLRYARVSPIQPRLLSAPRCACVC